MFNPQEDEACRRLVEIALAEDLAGQIDLTSHAFITAQQRGAAACVSRQAGVVAGLPAVALVLAAVDRQLSFEPLMHDGATVATGSVLGRIRGPMRSLLTAERTALNFLQHLSGVASITGHFVDAIAGLPCRIIDTRKTLPGWRLLDKYAVRCGGGHNHRLGLFDAVLIKDNHLAAVGGGSAAVARAVVAARAFAAEQQLPAPPLIEVEVDTLEQLDAALTTYPDMILLDNMTAAQLREAVQRRRTVAPQVLLEASGGVNLDTVRAIAETGVDRISVGALTHSAPALDIGLDYENG